METLLKLADLFLPLSEEKQNELLDFAEFLFVKHTNHNSNQHPILSENEKHIEPSEKLKNLLRERLSKHRAHPQASTNWNTLKAELLNKY